MLIVQSAKLSITTYMIRFFSNYPVSNIVLPNILIMFVTGYRDMQSNRRFFLGDVVLDSVNMAYREEDRIFDQIYHKQIVSVFNVVFIPRCIVKAVKDDIFQNIIRL